MHSNNVAEKPGKNSCSGSMWDLMSDSLSIKVPRFLGRAVTTADVGLHNIDKPLNSDQASHREGVNGALDITSPLIKQSLTSPWRTATMMQRLTIENEGLGAPHYLPEHIRCQAGAQNFWPSMDSLWATALFVATYRTDCYYEHAFRHDDDKDEVLTRGLGILSSTSVLYHLLLETSQVTTLWPTEPSIPWHADHQLSNCCQALFRATQALAQQGNDRLYPLPAGASTSLSLSHILIKYRKRRVKCDEQKPRCKGYGNHCVRIPPLT